MAEADRLSAQDLWPGFDPRVVPVAIYDGERTLLFRHRAPPEGFDPVPGHDSVWAYPGRHPSVTANSSEIIGGVRTATLMPATGRVALLQRAGILVHEMFHVFQGERHRGWSANEAELFAYPVDVIELIALRRLETEALQRALVARAQDRASCWARSALDLRRERFAGLPAGSVAYERGTELNEGLATYVQYRATGELNTAVLPAEAFAPEAVRQRGYASGLALARLLDRFSPTWPTTLEKNDSTFLDILLSTALDAHGQNVPSCAFAFAERARIQNAAAKDIAALRTRRAEQRRTFLEQAGWRLIVVAPSAPFFPQGFDPLNVQTVASGEVLHTRFLKLGNDAGTVEVLGRATLTESAGAHPLFNGVRTLTVTGLVAVPIITQADSVVTIKADGVDAKLRGATVERTGQSVTVRLP